MIALGEVCVRRLLVDDRGERPVFEHVVGRGDYNVSPELWIAPRTAPAAFPEIVEHACRIAVEVVNQFRGQPGIVNSP